jgi:predicted permease
VLTAVLWPPRDVSDPGRLYQIRPKTWMVARLLTTSYPAFEDFRRRNTTLTDLAAFYGYSRARLAWGHAVARLHGYEVTGNYFELLGVQPEVGRFFQAGDERGLGSAPYVVLSHGLWRRAFAADPRVVGTTVELSQRPFTVIGVAPEWFHGTERFVWPDYWIPLVNKLGGTDSLRSRRQASVTVIGRLQPGVTRQQATDDLNAVAAQLAKEYPDTDEGLSVRLIRPGLIGDNGEVIRAFLYGITALALLVLAAACANLASLSAARVADRRRELALRAALGSSRWALARQLLTEAGLLAVMGGVAGLAAGHLLLGALDRWRPGFGRLAVSVDGRVYLAALAFTVGSALLFGMLPARQAWRSHPLQMMKGGSPGSLHVRRFALRDLLLGAQVVVCTVLITASLMAVRGMVRTLRTPLGFQPQGALLVEMDLGEAGYEEGAALEKQKEVLEAVGGMAGVTAAGAASRRPMTGGIRGVPVYRPGTTELTLQNAVLEPYVFSMSPGFLEAAGTRLLRGRDVSWHDRPGTPRVAIVNETFARRMWGDGPAIGQAFLLRDDLMEVVGVAEDGKYHHLTESPQSVVYLPLSQSGTSGGVIVVRSGNARNEMAATLQRTLSALEPNAPITVRSWPEALGYELFPARAAAVVLGVTGLLAAMLAVTGLFGMAANAVSRRLKELGIRVALGARRTEVMRAALGRPLVLLGVGSIAGLLTGILAGPLWGRIVHQADPGHPAVVGGVLVTMALVGVAASALPAWRAIAVDPARLLRED